LSHRDRSALKTNAPKISAINKLLIVRHEFKKRLQKEQPIHNGEKSNSKESGKGRYVVIGTTSEGIKIKIVTAHPDLEKDSRIS
jgi:hypothetical protein